MGTIAMPRIHSLSGVAHYFCNNPWFLWGILLDILVLPFALLMFCVKWLYPHDLDQFKTSRTNPNPVVILVHGSGSNEAQWLINRIHLSYSFDVYSVQLNSVPANSHEDIDLYVDKLRDKMRTINIRDRKVVLIGHSMGGLVCAKYATIVHDIGNITDIITIGTPWRGAPALNWVKFDTIRHTQMTPDSDFLRTLVFRDKIRYYCFGGKADMQVPFSHSAPLGYYHNVRKIQHYSGHTSALFDVVMWRRIHLFINEGLYHHSNNKE